MAGVYLELVGETDEASLRKAYDTIMENSRLNEEGKPCDKGPVHVNYPSRTLHLMQAYRSNGDIVLNDRGRKIKFDQLEEIAQENGLRVAFFGFPQTDSQN